MTRNVAGVLAAVVVLAGVAALGVVLVQQGSESPPGAPAPSASGMARAYPTREDGCRDLLRRGLLNTDIPKRVAFRDSDRLSKKLVHDFDSRVMGLGVSKCGEHWVLVAYVLPGHAPVPAHGPRGTPVIALGMQDPRSPGYPSIAPSPTPSALPHPPGTAGVYPTFEEGCDDLLRQGFPKDVSKRVASRDSERLADQLITDASDVNLLAVSKCAGHWVLKVGVAAAETTVPARGPGGTPVIAYLQGEFRPF